MYPSDAVETSGVEPLARRAERGEFARPRVDSVGGNQPLGGPGRRCNPPLTVSFGMADSPGESIGPLYELELTAGREAIAEVLNGVVDRALMGAIRLRAVADAVSVGVPDDLSLENEFEDEADESSPELEHEWPAPDKDATDPSFENRPGGASEEPTLVRAADGSASLARFDGFRDRGEEWRRHLRHRNGNIIAIIGEGSSRKHNARNGLRSVIENSAEAEIMGTHTN